MPALNHKLGEANGALPQHGRRAPTAGNGAGGLIISKRNGPRGLSQSVGVGGNGRVDENWPEASERAEREQNSMGSRGYDAGRAKEALQKAKEARAGTVFRVSSRQEPAAESEIEEEAKENSAPGASTSPLCWPRCAPMCQHCGLLCWMCTNRCHARGECIHVDRHNCMHLPSHSICVCPARNVPPTSIVGDHDHDNWLYMCHLHP